MKIMFLTALALILLPPFAFAESKPPNIVVMMVDDMGFAGPSCEPYGNPNYKTPGMDRLAAEGLRFTDFYSSGTVCSPTRAGLLTGRYQQRAGIEAVIHPHTNHPEHRKWLHASEVTFAELFKDAGYATGLVGKWHLGYPEGNDEVHPQNHGFDYFKGYHSGNIDYINHWGDHMKHDWWHGRKETVEEGYTTHLINQYALEFIEANKDKPFCLYVAHESPHAPVQGPNDPIQRGPGTQKRTTPHEEAMKQMILEMDKGVEQVRAKLVELGLEKNTLFLFFSDNGDSPRTATGSPRFRGHKGSVYEGGTRVPAIAWWPGKIQAGASTDELSISLDVMPTILSAADISIPQSLSLDGRDLSPVLFKQKTLPERPLFWASMSNSGNRSEALRDGPWKLVVQHPKAKPGTFENEKVELYNLSTDESENTNLAAKHPDRAADMLKRIKDWYTEMQKTATPQPGGWLPKKDTGFFNGKDLSGWQGNDGFWWVKDGTIVGHSEEKVAKNEFIWSEVEVADFYFSVDVRLTPNNRNAGIQFRSKSVNDHGQAHGYQADVGSGVWGKLYHEHGRGKLDWNNHAKEIVKPGDWNHYEILAVGDRIWTAINGKLCVAVRDPKGERSGKIALQIHSGPPQTVEYRNPSLTHNPKVALAEMNEKELNATLKVLGKPAPKPPRIQARTSDETQSADAPSWKERIAATDPGSQNEIWAKPTFDDSKWKTMKLPGHFDRVAIPNFDGVVWFRKTIDLSADQAAASKAKLGLGQIDDMDATWVNGKRVGGYETPGHHYTIRNYTIPPATLRAGKNTIAVRVMDHGLPGGIAGKPAMLFLQLGDQKISLANEWRLAPGASLKILNTTKISKPTSAAPITKTGKFSQGFALKKDDVVAFIGGSHMVKQAESAALESYLTHATSDTPVYFRDLAWQADTVYFRQRPRNFGTQAEALNRIQATVVISAFGQMEAMDGTNRLSEFITAYEALLEEAESRTGKIVLVTPFPFQRSDNPHLPDLTIHNQSVAAYAKAIVELAERRGLVAIDLSQLDTAGMTIDGLQLTPEGHTKWARAVTHQLLGKPTKDLPKNWHIVHQKIQKKNRLWKRHWRPSNWAFLYGNRQTQPSSHDHRPGKPRWFPEEINAIIPIIEKTENEILELRDAAK